jgi:serine phosphatase RsbU (regulator of sigma subunit)
MAPLLRTAAGEVTEIGNDITGLPLGVLADFAYEQITCTLAPGDLVTLYTDGISEAMNQAGDLYTIGRLQLQLRQAAAGEEMGSIILKDVKQFVGTHAQSDDMCLACFGRLD